MRNSYVYIKTLRELGQGLVSIVSLINSFSSATLFIGVTNTGEVLGVRLGKKVIIEIGREIEYAIFPKVSFKIDLVQVNLLDIIKITFTSSERSHRLYGRYYMRICGNDMAMTKTQILFHLNLNRRIQWLFPGCLSIDETSRLFVDNHRVFRSTVVNILKKNRKCQIDNVVNYRIGPVEIGNRIREIRRLLGNNRTMKNIVVAWKSRIIIYRLSRIYSFMTGNHTLCLNLALYKVQKYEYFSNCFDEEYLNEVMDLSYIQFDFYSILQEQIIRLIYHDNSITVKQLSLALGTTSQVISRNIAYLIRQRIVERGKAKGKQIWILKQLIRE